MSKRKYFSWTDEKRGELRGYIDAHEDRMVAFKEAAVLFGVSTGSCYTAYKYKPKRIIVNEVDPSELESRKERVMDTRTRKPSLNEEAKEAHAIAEAMANARSYGLKIDIHNDINNECLVIHVNDSVTVLKVGDIIVTLEV